MEKDTLDFNDRVFFVKTFLFFALCEALSETYRS